MNLFEKELKRLKEEKLYRERTQIEGLKDFCSNDYLGLRKHPEVIEESIKVLREYGLGSGASQLVSGYTKYHKILEEKLAELKGTEKCILFGSGYLANIGTIPALVGEGDLILSDELNHASIIDGVRLSKAQRIVFKHKNYEFLEEFLRKNRKNYKKVLIITDTVFSMDGDIADLRRLFKICKEYECLLYVDEAHATGTIGETGKGGLEHFNLKYEDFLIIMGTLSKAIGSYGAFVCGSKKIIEYLVNKARSLIFSTSLPPSVCAGAVKAIEIIQKNGEKLIKSLRNKENEVLKILKDLNLEYKYYETPIIPILVYEEERALNISKKLRKEGIFLQAIRYPTVPKGKARLRLTVSLNYSKEDLELLRQKLEKVLKEREKIRTAS